MKKSVYVLSFYSTDRVGGFDWVPADEVTIGQMLERIHEEMVQAVGEGRWEWNLHKIDIPGYVSPDSITEYIEYERLDEIESSMGAIASISLNS